MIGSNGAILLEAILLKRLFYWPLMLALVLSFLICLGHSQVRIWFKHLFRPQNLNANNLTAPNLKAPNFKGPNLKGPNFKGKGPGKNTTVLKS